MHFYDPENNYISDGIVFISALAKDNVTGEKLSLNDFIADQDGYLQVFVAYENGKPVWFDDLRITHQPALVVQENHYYPFGLNITTLEKQGVPEHRFQYMGVEKEESFGLSWTETQFRRYDTQLGRFHGLDAMSENLEGINPYSYSFNNPIKLNDPSGLIPQIKETSLADKAAEATREQMKGFTTGMKDVLTNSKSLPLDDYFDYETGEYLGSDGEGNGIRLTKRKALEERGYMANDGNIDIRVRQRASFSLRTFTENNGTVSDALAVALANHYYEELGHELDDLVDFSFQSSEGTALGTSSALNKFKQIKMVINPSVVGRELVNSDDFTNAIVHEWNHAERIFNGEGKNYNKSNFKIFWDFESTATREMVSHSTWRNTSLTFKTHMYNVYGKHIFNKTELQRHFFDYRVEK